MGMPGGVVTEKVSLTVPPPASVPVNVTVGAGSNAKNSDQSVMA